MRNCHYWVEGMACSAREILITSDVQGGLAHSKVQSSSPDLMPKTPVAGLTGTCCNTFATEGTFEPFLDGVMRVAQAAGSGAGSAAAADSAAGSAANNATDYTAGNAARAKPGAPGGVGYSVPRKESWDKVTGKAKYNGDTHVAGMLHARCLVSPHARATIKSIDVSGCASVPHVAILTGDQISFTCGPSIRDRPPLARGKVRYSGEPVAMVVAHTEVDAENALRLIKVEYEPLPVVNSAKQAVEPGAPLVHPDLGLYDLVSAEVYPKPGTNICNHIKIRKGNLAAAWQGCEVIVEADYSLPQSSHAAMETRNARAEIHADRQIEIWSATQAPFSIRKSIANYFNRTEDMVVVHAPLVGGGFGGKVSAQMEILACLASEAAGGRLVELANPREHDIIMSPAEPGMEAHVKLGATKNGRLKAAELTFLLDAGAYSDTAPRVARAIAADCTGPYSIENVWCDSICVYTNHPFATSFRGFGHLECNFPVERTLDKLANALGMDPLELREKNAVHPGDTSPTQSILTRSNLGDLDECLRRLRTLSGWDASRIAVTPEGKVRAKGVACLWKAPNPPTDASSGVALTFNSDGSLNVSFGAVEIGPGMKTTIAQIVAEKMKMHVGRIHVAMDVNTQVSPLHWKTVASMTTFMAGNAALDATARLIDQLKRLGAIALRCHPEDLDVGDEKVYLKDFPEMSIGFKELVFGVKHPNGNAVGGQAMAQGSYILRHLTTLEHETGRGTTTPTRTVGAQSVEVEFDPSDCTYRVLKAVTVIDAGRVVNPMSARGVIMGGMSMGLGLATRESFEYSPEAAVQNTSLRTYKLLRFGGHPEYVAEFVETPQVDAPFGARAIGEHGIIGIPAALANALSAAAQVELDSRPISPETIWKARRDKIG
ncbi:MAG: xanthine dehydrogenase family protein molybdopterin-binding subunit [Bacillota bacterium]